MGKIIESLRDDLAVLHEVGAISKVTMREFDAICPPPVREFSAADIKHLREALMSTSPDQVQSKPEVPDGGVSGTRRVSDRQASRGESVRCSRSSSVRCVRALR